MNIKVNNKQIKNPIAQTIIALMVFPLVVLILAFVFLLVVPFVFFLIPPIILIAIVAAIFGGKEGRGKKSK